MFFSENVAKMLLPAEILLWWIEYYFYQPI